MDDEGAPPRRRRKPKGMQGYTGRHEKREMFRDSFPLGQAVEGRDAEGRRTLTLETTIGHFVRVHSDTHEASVEHADCLRWFIDGRGHDPRHKWAEPIPDPFNFADSAGGEPPTWSANLQANTRFDAAEQYPNAGRVSGSDGMNVLALVRLRPSRYLLGRQYRDRVAAWLKYVAERLGHPVSADDSTLLVIVVTERPGRREEGRRQKHWLIKFRTPTLVKAPSTAPAGVKAARGKGRMNQASRSVPAARPKRGAKA